MKQFIDTHLGSEYGLTYRIGKSLTELFPEQVVLPISHGDYNLEAYVRAGKATATFSTTFGYLERELTYRTWWSDDEPGETQQEALIYRNRNIVREVHWEGHDFLLIELSWLESSYGRCHGAWLVAASTDLGEAFYRALCSYESVVRDEILIYSDGYWRKDQALYHAVQSATLDGLVLAPGLKEAVHSDLTQFFERREVYRRYGIPWKRGILLVGPPGNGKTHTIKALVRASGKTALYVRSLKDSGCSGSDHTNISAVFSTARDKAPCLLILEDLDTLVTAENRSFFLNELDGFAANAGIYVLATTNFPEKLDSAIVNRPSRFDRKYHFTLPAAPERRTYLALWNARQTEELRLTDDGLTEVAEATEGFSFAYLKEFCLSLVMAWINTPETPLRTVALEQVRLLREQMVSPAGESHQQGEKKGEGKP